jgi:hypothetical protein
MKFLSNCRKISGKEVIHLLGRRIHDFPWWGDQINQATFSYDWL